MGGIAVPLAGTTFDGRSARIAEAKACGARMATLTPDPSNKFDDGAIKVTIEGIGEIGMVPKTSNQSIVRTGQVPIVRMEKFTKGGEELWAVTIRAVPS